MDLLKDLNEEQKKAVTHGGGPLLIVAGAGTGKTTVITKRLAYLVEKGLARTDEILALTFTDKAAGEMEERIDKLLPYGYLDLWISTFHSFCQRILKDYGMEIGLSSDFKLLDETEQWMLIRKNLDKFDLDYYKPLGRPTKFIKALVKHISRVKDETITPEEYLNHAENLKLNSDSAEFIKRMNVSQTEGKEVLGQEIKRLTEIAESYQTYQKLLGDNDYLDFGDLINLTIKLFKERPKILSELRKQFKYILVDEFQDTNWAQFELLKLLAAPNNNITVVGDDDQCLPGSAKILTKQGERAIKQIKVGDEVATAVGRGYLSYGPITKVFKNDKSVINITFTTKNGHQLTVTDNHKLFSLVPVRDRGNYYYVYLMHRRGFGWRMGVTNHLPIRLKLERSADKIIGIKTCASDEEARFYETLYSLRYNIPTVCFAPRKGVAIKGEWLDKLYYSIDTEKNVRALAKDLNIDLDSHHYSLGAVNRGKRLRIKINLEICTRRYRSKDAKNNYLRSPQVLHLLHLETSDKDIVKLLRRLGYILKKTKKKGYRLRIYSTDLGKLGEKAIHIAKLTDGIIEHSFKVGKTNIQTKKSLVMPAKNVLVGHYLPIVTNQGIIYDEIIKKDISRSNRAIVYDLEVKPTHNFIANGIVVHNSIYKFRGASVSNILDFKELYPDSKEVFLTANYRSKQNILDLAYDFIQQNNPDRLEYKFKDKKLSKKLIAQVKGGGEIEHLPATDADDEARLVVKKILELLANKKAESLNDFAILVRANSSASYFINALAEAEIDFQFLASRGLFSKPIIQDVISYFKLLDDYHESTALFRVLNWKHFKIPSEEIIKLTHLAKRKSWSLFEALDKYHGHINLDKRTKSIIFKLKALIARHSEIAKTKSPQYLLIKVLVDFAIQKHLDAKPTYENHQQLWQLNQFFKEIVNFSTTQEDARLKNFMDYLNILLESGEEGSLPPMGDEGPEAVTIMTIHSAKGLEFPYVFIANLVDKRFPTVERKEFITIPDELVKEKLPEGDIHLQEERRLFYVAITRAKQGVYFTSARDYGGTTVKKPSRFLKEIGFVKEKVSTIKDVPTLSLGTVNVGKKAEEKIWQPPLPKSFSFSQFRAFEICPYQYRYAFLLKIPVKGKAVFSFGKSMHHTLYQMYKLAESRRGGGPVSLFDAGKPARKEEPLNKLVNWKDVQEIYEKVWQDDWFDSKEEQREYKREGLEQLKKYYAKEGKNATLPYALEEDFLLKLDSWLIKGRVDRIDVKEKEVEIIDYKTGKVKEEEKLAYEDKLQLFIYHLALEQDKRFKDRQFILSYYYLTNASKATFTASELDLEKARKDLIKLCQKIKTSDFTATSSKYTCAFCDFKDICPFKA